MQTKTRTATVHTHYIEIDGVEYETTFPADEYIDPKVETEDGKTVITYATHDDYYPWNPIEDDSYIEFQEFDNVWDRDSFAEIKMDEGWSVFFVNHYEHSLSSYSVIEGMTLCFVCDYCGADFETRAAGDEGKCEAQAGNPEWEGHDVSARARSASYRAGWDDRPSGVIAIHPEITNPLKAAVSSMNTYTAWANGEVYTIVREEYEFLAPHNQIVHLDYDCVGGYFGSEDTEAAIKDGAF